MTPYHWITNEFAPAFCRMFLHSLWIGVAAALLAFLIIAATKKSSALTRYNYLVFLFATVVGISIFMFVKELKACSLAAEASSEALVTGNFGGDLMNSTVLTNDYFFPSTTAFSRVLLFLDKHSQSILFYWSLIFCFRLIRMFTGLSYVHKLRHTKVYAVEENWSEWMQAKSRELGIQKTILFLQSELIKIPVALGHLKPVILVPVGLLSNLSPQQVESILIHELAHIRRKDYLVNLLQCFIDIVFFFNPAFLWLSSLIRQEREKCCDDIAVQHCDRMDYLNALMSFQTVRSTGVYAMALGTQKQSLFNRVKRLLASENSRLTKNEFYLLILAVSITAFSFMAFRPEENKETTPVQKEIRRANQQSGEREEQGVKKIVPMLNKTVSEKRRDSLPPSSTTSGFSFGSDGSVTFRGDTNSRSPYSQHAFWRDGKGYIVRKSDSQIVSISIDGREVSRNDPDYVFLEKDVQHYADSLKREMEDRRKALEVRRSELQAKTKQNRERFDNTEVSKERRSNNQSAITALGPVLPALEPTMPDVPEKADKATSASNSKVSTGDITGFLISAIIADLMADEIIKSNASLSFSLKNEQFIVNGVQQGPSISDKFRKKYLKHKDNFFFYSNKEGIIRTESYVK
jgi:bla regulator protein blaR1